VLSSGFSSVSMEKQVFYKREEVVERSIMSNEGDAAVQICTNIKKMKNMEANLI